MSRLSWTFERVKSGPADDDSLIQAAIAMLIYWRYWAVMAVLWAGIAITMYLFSADAALGGWIIGLFTGQISWGVARSGE